MAAFERMEEKVEAMKPLVRRQLNWPGQMESQFAALEGGNDIDDELVALRNQLAGESEAVALPVGEGKAAEMQPVKVEEVDADLEELKRSIDKLW